jgi:hypothetical protein
MSFKNQKMFFKFNRVMQGSAGLKNATFRDAPEVQNRLHYYRSFQEDGTSMQ